jgi:hypothetical protein
VGETVQEATAFELADLLPRMRIFERELGGADRSQRRARGAPHDIRACVHIAHSRLWNLLSAHCLHGAVVSMCSAVAAELSAAAAILRRDPPLQHEQDSPRVLDALGELICERPL